MTMSAVVRPLVLLAALGVAPAFAADAVLLEGRAPQSPKEIDGTVTWSRDIGEGGLTALKGRVVIADGNLAATVVFHRIAQPELQSDYAIDVTFEPGADFAAGSVHQLMGVLVRMEMEQGAPVEGASARTIGNSFLFATSRGGNAGILTTGNWIDFAIIYESGQRAILGLGVDDVARDALAEMLL